MKTLIESLEKTESYCQEIPYYPTSLKRPAPPPCSEEILPFLFLLPLAQKQTVTERSIRLAAGFQLIHLSRAIHETIQPQTCPENRAIVLEGDLLSSLAYKIMIEEDPEQLADAANIMAQSSEAWFLYRDFRKKRNYKDEDYWKFLQKDYGLLCRRAAKAGAKEAQWTEEKTEIFCDMAEHLAYIYSIVKRNLPLNLGEEIALVRKKAEELQTLEEIESMLSSLSAVDSSF